MSYFKGGALNVITVIDNISELWQKIKEKEFSKMWNAKEVCCAKPAKPFKVDKVCKLPTGVSEIVLAYKCVHDNHDGTFCSCWAGQGQPNITLGYLIDHVTTAPKGSEGIFTQDTEENAVKQAKGKLGFVVEPTAVLEVICLGEKNKFGRYNQVLVEDVVWEDC